MKQQLVLGIDGGGTKTAFELADLSGIPLAAHTDIGSSYQQHGYDGVLATLRRGQDACLEQTGAARGDITAVCVGLPCFDEFPEHDRKIEALIREAFAPAAVRVINDTEVAWAGSLARGVGINVVAGTGSVSFGRDSAGNTARCGGWSATFGDEGSSYWAGIKAMELFMKEVDGRLPRGPLYDILREELKLPSDIAFIALMHEEYLPHRDKTASLQMLLEKAAIAGDEAARGVYEKAAEELALLVMGANGRLGLAAPFPVSYSGGMFKAGDLILPAFQNSVEALGGMLVHPIHSPVHGAVLLALELVSQ